ncbi:uncharacterized protein JCM6883_004560 [Sporobolomyces salmoneus]|uniref:uncharacterized protein n=1 Tax=Sporobolomyces salmoneus TaxID=183962 RepID=UPI0031726675
MSSSSRSSSSAASDEETWDDWTEESQPAQSLFDQQSFPSAQLALQHDKETHGVDLPLLAGTLDFFERIRLINYIRTTKPDPASLRRLDRNASFLDDDQYLKPVIENDALLQLDFDSLSLSSSADASTSAHAGTSSSSPSAQDPTARDLIEALQAQLADSQAANESLRKIVRDRCGGAMGLDQVVGAQNGDEEAEVKASQDKGKGKGKEEERKDGEAAHKDDAHYFESYQYNDIHEIMLKDAVRTNAYRDFILHPANAPVIKDKIVLDVGCGTGILSMFAAKAGAKKVYAVDASNVAYKAMRNIKANGFQDVIQVIKGKVEEIELPEKVDVIISEWMGYCLLYECMLDSVLLARDKYLAPNGLMIPSQTSILLSAYAGQPWINDRVKYWDNVYGFDMSCMKEGIEDEAIIEVYDNGEVVSGEQSITDILTGTTSIAALSFTSPFKLPINRSPSSSPSATTFLLHSFLAHFDTYFTSSARLADSSLRKESIKGEDGEIFFTTGAWDTPTHWKQTAFLLKEPIEVEIGSSVEGTIKVAKNPDNSRELLVEMVWNVVTKAGEKRETQAQVWKVR